ncbi:MAG: hypothetical protein ACFE0K_00340 [Alcanivorax sp.]|uniref:hypothetical protein n=1 Tax=Alcanivorax sp. TaxID=1872427 RepID=UPI003DA72CB3
MGPDILSLIPAIAPGTLVAITAFVLAGIFMQRARTAAMLVMIAGLLTLLQNGWIIFNQTVLLEWMFDDVISSDTYSLIATAAAPHRSNPVPKVISRPIEAGWC